VNWTAGILPAPGRNLVALKKENVGLSLIEFKGNLSFLLSPLNLLPGSRLEDCGPSELDRRHLACPRQKFSGT
jgi:hypothetical protein